MKEALLGLFGSKKALMALGGSAAATLVTIAGKYGVMLDPAGAEKLVLVILGIVSAYVLGQGIADRGKEAAKIQVAATEALMDKDYSQWGPEDDDGAKVLIE